jgi:hypothetical protein
MKNPENAAPELSDTPVSRPGDLWCMGPHRLVCGDSTDEKTVKALLGSIRPNLMVTDPPYGVAYDPTWRHRAGVNRSSRVGKVRNDENANWQQAWRYSPAPSPTSGMAPFTQPRSPRAWLNRALLSVLRSSGPRRGWSSGVATITGSTSLAGMPFATRGIGQETASKRPYGPCRAGIRTPRLSTALRSQSSACGGRS